MRKVVVFSGLILVVAVFISSCTSKPFEYKYYTSEEVATLDQYVDVGQHDIPEDYKVDFPEHLASQGLFPRAINDDRATLGRVLFYDKNLSRTGTIACASCHKQEIGFSDDKSVSLGVEDREGVRNAIALSSVANFSAYYGTDLNGSNAIRFLWDNRAGTAREQAKAAITNEKEMDMHMNEIVERVKNLPYYPILFKYAYDGAVIDETNVLDAIANFVDAMGSYKSKFDTEARKKYQGGYVWGTEPVKESFAGFTASENAGKEIYMNKCASCHSPIAGRPMFNYANNGLDAVTGSDKGVGGVAEFVNFPDADGAFKVPTLRNIEMSAPYMHDGRFKNLEEVVEFYSSGVKNHPSLHQNMKAGGFGFTTQQKQDLITFLKTFTDNTIATEKKYSNPFN